MTKSATKDVTLAAYAITTDMEDDVRAIGEFAYAIACMAESANETDGPAVQRIAWTIRRLSEAIEQRRGDLFKLLHPDRARFEAAGWPGDEGRTA